jgi:cytoskeletal protein CcmA (bactofilin family)
MKSLNLFILFLLFYFSIISAAEYKSGESIRVSEGDTIAANLFAGTQYLDINGVVNGSIFAGSRQFNLNGDVAGNVFSGSEELTIRGKTKGMVISFSKLLVIDGEVGEDVISFAATVRITNRAHIKGNLFTGSGQLQFEGGKIDGWIRGGVGDLYLNGTAGDSVSLSADHVRFGEDYNSSKGTKLTLKKELDRERTPNVPDNLNVVVKPDTPFFISFYFYWSVVAMFIVGILLIVIFPNFSQNLLTYARENTLKSLGYGLLFVFLVPLLIAILTVLIITIPVAMILLAFYLIILYVSFIYAGMFLGRYMLNMIRKEESSTELLWPLVIGIVLVTLLPNIPFLGWIIKILLVCLGSGMVVTYLRHYKKNTAEL